ncbi:MAG: HlyD family secretion protein [Rhodospirillales bacterium]|nr:HlyD family secretion protein [Rhodospirillales bacterium]
MSQATASARVGSAEPAVRQRSRRQVLRPLLMLGGIAIVLVASVTLWLRSGRWVAIDDSYVRAGRLLVATDVSGIVASVDVHEGERVSKGQVLFRLDPRAFRIALDHADAELASARANAAAQQDDYKRMLQQAAAMAANVASDRIVYERAARLVGKSVVSRAEYDTARYKLAADGATLAALREQAQVQLMQIGGRPDLPVDQLPAVQAAQANVAEAQRQYADSIVRAPFAGVVTQVANLQPGTYLPAATAAFGLVSTTNIWIEANPKETELTWVKPGDKVDVSVDTYPGRVWKGVVQSVAPASGAEFSVLPAQNASGNWVKVVQRIPLRIALDPTRDAPVLRAGMSVTVDIDTRHVRTLSDLWPW